jgi:hypothetical protein
MKRAREVVGACGSRPTRRTGADFEGRCSCTSGEFGAFRRMNSREMFVGQGKKARAANPRGPPRGCHDVQPTYRSVGRVNGSQARPDSVMAGCVARATPPGACRCPRRGTERGSQPGLDHGQTTKCAVSSSFGVSGCA